MSKEQGSKINAEDAKHMFREWRALFGMSGPVQVGMVSQPVSRLANAAEYVASLEAAISTLPIAVEGNAPDEADGPFHVSRSADGEKQWFSARDAASGVSIPGKNRDDACALVKSLNRAFYLHLRMAASSPGKDGGQEVEAVAGGAAEIIRGFLDCPEIADCAPEDLDNETRDLERRARRFLSIQPTSTVLDKALRELLAHTDPYRDGRGTDAEIEARRKAVLALNAFDSGRLLSSTQPASTALVERLTNTLKAIREDILDYWLPDTAKGDAIKANMVLRIDAALSSSHSTIREGESNA